MSKPIQTSDIIFPVLSTDFSTTLSSLKRSTLSISNRLRSINDDSEFVCAVADAFKRPLVANERCGSWYIPLEHKAASAYFKSTDGHTGEWSFSLRRLNIQVLELVGQHDGCIIVDSTRRGKRMPDALSKTIPIWCAIWNALLFPSLPSSHTLHTPHSTISPSEHAQISARLPSFVASATSLNLPLARLRSQLKKPLRPLWVTRDSPLPASTGDEENSFPDFYPVICCTASRRVPGGEASEGGYVQGAGDDSEGWACGLTAPLFWTHKARLLSTPESDLPEVINELVKLSVENGSSGATDAVLVAPTEWLYISTLDAAKAGEFDAIIACSEAPDETLQARMKNNYLYLKCGTGKLGSRDLRNEIPKIEAFMRDRVPADASKLAVCCPTGKDLSAGVALALLCLYAAQDGKPAPFIQPQSNPSTHLLTNEKIKHPGTRSPIPTTAITKPFIRQRLSWIMTSFPAASPSRATLQSINAFLFSPRDSPKATAPSPPPPPSAEPSAPAPTPLARTFSSLSTATPSRPWTLTRTLASALSTMPSGTYTGTATFVPRAPSAPGYDAEYLYAEEGTFRTEGGLEFAARRRYVWRYRGGKTQEEGADKGEGITMWFVKEDGESVDYLFLDMEFDASEEEREGEGILRAKGWHPCGEDVYDARFVFGGDGGQGMRVTYVVKGPRKDYVSDTRYTR
ncbi:Initiator tRNA phosphoribosyl transferase [Macrophomina phaseolina MS6]|uniref:Initiator tRNA phosphoribosyl transferase n=1 Tax=Macrophomina phaseolina (strain MS6) TaxID=1126212 RepID=K2R165_MACPH|nr:Initiator tRNA phosphoribosyl transferase [Macrophomina phaseolina MS6]